jgi:hypothetical protein
VEDNSLDGEPSYHTSSSVSLYDLHQKFKEYSPLAYSIPGFKPNYMTKRHNLKYDPSLAHNQRSKSPNKSPRKQVAGAAPTALRHIAHHNRSVEVSIGSGSGTLIPSLSQSSIGKSFKKDDSESKIPRITSQKELKTVELLRPQIKTIRLKKSKKPVNPKRFVLSDSESEEEMRQPMRMFKISSAPKESSLAEKIRMKNYEEE